MNNYETYLTGLAFPVARVKYHGPTNSRGARYVATIKSGERTWRVTESYDHSEQASVQAEILARHVYHNMRSEFGLAASVIAVSGRLDADSYVFTFVPTELLDELLETTTEVIYLTTDDIDDLANGASINVPETPSSTIEVVIYGDDFSAESIAALRDGQTVTINGHFFAWEER